jgi:hypothetical protein
MRLNTLNTFRAALSIVLILASARFAAAEVMVAPTLEWLADHCVELGIYRVTGVEKQPDIAESYRVTLARRTALRGEPKESIEESYYSFGSLPAGDKPLVKVGDEFLVCFQHAAADRIACQLVNLSNPQASGPQFIAVTSDFKVLKDGDAIVKFVHARLKRHPDADPVQHGDHSKDNRVELQPGMEPYDAIYAGSSCYLKVPKDLLRR